MRIRAAAMLMFLSTAAQAQSTQPAGTAIQGRSVAPVGMLIAGFDGDGDARTSHNELRLGGGRAFALADADQNGRLSLIELSSWSTTWLGDGSALPGRFDFDRDADDSISAAEFATELDRRFARYDVDKDGFVVRGELLQEVQRPPQRREQRVRLPDPPQRGQ